MAEGGDCFSGSGRGRGMRFGQPMQRPPLRQPTSNLGSNKENAATVSTVDSTQNNASVNSPKYISGVNDTVADKVPEKKHELSATAPEFIPRSCLTIAMPNKVHQQEAVAPVANSADVEFLLDQLRHMISEMSNQPAKFDLMATSILEMLTSSASSTSALTAVVNTIFDKSVVEPNLRYNGARLCNYLSQNVLTDANDKAFRTALLNRCQTEFAKRAEYAQNPEQHVWLHGLAHFFGELFIHLELGAPSGSHTCRANILGTNLCVLLELLLDYPSDLNFKCVAQVLKFSGAVIEDELQLTNNSETMEKLMQKIKDVTSVDLPNVKIHLKEMLQKVVELKASNWGRTASSPVHRDENLVGDVPYGDAVLYGPDGQPLTLEESSFLESDQYLYEAEEDFGEYAEYGQGEVWSTGDDQMDDEMAAAYEEFLAQQKTQHRP